MVKVLVTKNRCISKLQTMQKNIHPFDTKHTRHKVQQVGRLMIKCDVPERKANQLRNKV